jgi:hypothetical protein
VIFYLLTTVLGSIVGGTFSVLDSTLGGAGRTAASAAIGMAQTTDAGGLEAQLRSLVNLLDTQSVQNNLVAYIRASAGGDQRAASEARDRGWTAWRGAPTSAPTRRGPGSGGSSSNTGRRWT